MDIKRDGNVFTLKAVGMGNSSHDEIGRATYYVLYDDSEQGLLLATNSIPYDYKNTINTLNLSNNHSRKKMQSWIGTK